MRNLIKIFIIYMDKWVMCIITLIFGMLMFHILKGVCGCKVLEGHTIRQSRRGAGAPQTCQTREYNTDNWTDLPESPGTDVNGCPVYSYDPAARDTASTQHPIVGRPGNPSAQGANEWHVGHSWSDNYYCIYEHAGRNGTIQEGNSCYEITGAGIKNSLTDCSALGSGWHSGYPHDKQMHCDTWDPSHIQLVAPPQHRSNPSCTVRGPRGPEKGRNGADCPCWKLSKKVRGIWRVRCV
jgi:hypothetical protein